MVEISLNTEMNEMGRPGHQGWVLYDGDCPMCVGLARRFEETLKRRGFALAALQTPWVQNQLQSSPGELLTEMRVFTAQGRVLGGADALVHLARTLWWAWPLYALAQLPGMRGVVRAAYRWVAARRHCSNGTCMRPKVPGRSHE